MDILGKYEAEKKEQGEKNSFRRPSLPSLSGQRFFYGLRTVLESARESQLPLLVISGVMLVFSLFILFDFIAPAPARIEPLPVGAFPTLELRRTSSLDYLDELAKHDRPKEKPQKPFLHAFR